MNRWMDGWMFEETVKKIVFKLGVGCQIGVDECNIKTQITITLISSNKTFKS